MSVRVWKELKKIPAPRQAAGLCFSALPHTRGTILSSRPAVKFVIEGHERYQARGQTIDLLPGDMMMVGPDVELTTTICTGEAVTKGICFYFDADMAGAQGPNAADVPFTRVDAQNTEFGHWLGKAAQYFDPQDQNTGGQFAGLYDHLNASFAGLVDRVRTDAMGIDARRSQTTYGLYNKVQTAKSLLRTDLQGQTSLDELARDVGLSKHHLVRVFKQVCGVAPMKYRDRARLDAAAEFLAEGGRVVDVAEALAFADAATFSKAFKRHFGLAPQAYLQAAAK